MDEIVDENWIKNSKTMGEKIGLKMINKVFGRRMEKKLKKNGRNDCSSIKSLN